MELFSFVKKEQEENKKKKKWLVILVFSALIIFGLIVISGLNKPFLSPFTTKVDLGNPIDVTFSEEKHIFVDSQGKRMLICDANNALLAIVDTEKSGSPVEAFSHVIVNGDTIYATGYTKYNKGIYFASEKLVTYDLKGKLKDTLVTREYSEEEHVTQGRFSRPSFIEDTLILSCFNEIDLTLNRVDIVNGELEPIFTAHSPETIYQAIMVPSLKHLYVLGRSMNWYVYDQTAGSLVSTEFSSVVSAIIEASGFNVSDEDIQEIQNMVCYPIVTYDENGRIISLVFVKQAGGDVKVISNDGTSVHHEVHYGTVFLIKNLLHWISIGILGILILGVCVWALIKKLNAKGRISLLLILVILFISVYYTRNNQKSMEAQYEQQMITQTEQMTFLLSKNMGDQLQTIAQTGISKFCKNPENQALMDEQQATLKTLASANGTENGMFINLYLYGTDGTCYHYLDSRNNMVSGILVNMTDEIRASLENAGEYNVITQTMARDTYVYDYGKIFDSKENLVGMLCIGCLRGNLDYTLQQDSLELFIDLLVVLISIYVLISAGQTFAGDFKRLRKRNRSNPLSAGSELAGVYSFILSLIFSMDSAIIVYVAKSLCVGMDPAVEAILVSLPIAAVSAGSLLGGFNYTALERFLGEKLLNIFAGLLMVASLVGMVISIRITNIYLYIISKMVAGYVFGGIIMISSDTLPYRTKDQKSQKSIINSTIQATAAASILSCLLGGYLADHLSYDAIYVVAIVFCIPMLLLAAFIFTGKRGSSKGLENTGREKSADGTWRVFLKAPMLMYLIFYYIPVLLVSGYKSYLFPLYTAGAGISAMLLSNLSVFSKTLTYICNDPLQSFANKFKPTVMMIVPSLVICIGLICFVISPNVYWAIIMLFMVDLLSRLPRVPGKMYVVNVANEYGLDIKAVQSHNKTITSAMGVFKSPVLSGFVSLGINLACAVTGIVSGVLICIFGVFSKKNDIEGP